MPFCFTAIRITELLPTVPKANENIKLMSLKGGIRTKLQRTLLKSEIGLQIALSANV